MRARRKLLLFAFILVPFFAFAQEPDQVAQLDFVIAFVRSGTKLHFLDDDLLLLELRFVPLLALTVFELTVIHDATDGRHRGRSDFNEIQLGFFCHFIGRSKTYDADLLTTRTDQPHFQCVDLAIDPSFLFLSYATVLPC